LFKLKYLKSSINVDEQGIHIYVSLTCLLILLLNNFLIYISYANKNREKCNTIVNRKVKIVRQRDQFFYREVEKPIG
jgi:hypothetical protein